MSISGNGFRVVGMSLVRFADLSGQFCWQSLEFCGVRRRRIRTPIPTSSRIGTPRLASSASSRYFRPMRTSTSATSSRLSPRIAPNRIRLRRANPWYRPSRACSSAPSRSITSMSSRSSRITTTVFRSSRRRPNGRPTPRRLGRGPRLRISRHSNFARRERRWPWQLSPASPSSAAARAKGAFRCQ